MDLGSIPLSNTVLSNAKNESLIRDIIEIKIASIIQSKVWDKDLNLYSFSLFFFKYYWLIILKEVCLVL